jgi:glycosyltransferase involved in cell wall biosynthesis
MLSNRVSRVAIVCGYPFPDGLAPTSRILAYAKGLVEEGVIVDIFIYFPTDNVKGTLPVCGEINGINYHYPGTRKYPENNIIRKLSHFYYCIRAIRSLVEENKKSKFDIVIISSDWFRILYTFIPVVKNFNAKVVFIADEFPVPIRVHLKSSIPSWRKFFFRHSLKYVSGMIFMTQALQDFYSDIVRKPSFILPSITDISRFLNLSEANPVKRHLCYMGNMELSKDNVDNIIEAFNLITKKYSDVELHLYGSPSSADKTKLTNLVQKYQLQDRISFKGRISNDLVPSVLKNSYVLVSSQPDTRRAAGGFPTKLGEYMATGVPTVLTKVGEIPNYITDAKNGWLVEPNNPIEYAAKLEFIFENYTEALKVADTAKSYIIENFSYKVQCARLLIFLTDVVNE